MTGKMPDGTGRRAALWVRVSSGDQNPANQVAQLEAWAAHRGLVVVATYGLQESAWKGAHRKLLEEVLADARADRFEVVLVWALDRLSREGPLATLQLVDRFGRLGVQVLSHQEPWTEASGELRDLLLAVVGWIARWESHRRSERTRAGLARARAEGKHLGRPMGARDRKRRRRSGYFARWADRAAG